METFRAASLKAFGEALGLMRSLSWVGTTEQTLSQEVRTALLEELNDLKMSCDILGLTQTMKQVDRVETELARDTYSRQKASDHAGEVSRRLADELDTTLFLHVSGKDALFYTEPFRGWDVVLAHFPGSLSDVEEASKCLALGRYTAAVFHLMRIMELGLRSLATTLNDQRLDPARNPNWGTILNKCDEELAKPRADRAPEWKADEPFFSGVAARLRAVKDAWRNPTMHVETTYTDETALEVWNHVQAFMRHLATKLSE